MWPEWYVRSTFENPPGDMFLEEDPMGRWPKPQPRIYGMAVWSVVAYRGRFDSGGPRHMSRRRFRYVVWAVLALWAALFAILVIVLAK